MNDQFQTYLMGILEKTGEFLSSEIPEVANQILNFYLSISIMYAVVFSLAVIAFVLSVKPFIKYTEGFRDPTDKEGARVLYFSIVGAVAVVFLFSALIEIVTILQICLAPKLFLLEYAANLVK